MHAFHYFFNWYNGQIWPNLVASAITTAFVWLYGLRRLKKLHLKHHDELRAHISAEIANLTDRNTR